MTREDKLKRLYHLLNTDEGRMLMDELERICDPPVLFEREATALAYATGARDMYMQLRQWQRAEHE